MDRLRHYQVDKLKYNYAVPMVLTFWRLSTM